MKLFTGWVISAGLVVAAGAANAQVLAPYEVGRQPYRVVSDIGGPYAAMPREVPVPGYGPRLLPPEEVYTVLRDSGFSPLGIPRRRGLVYTISVIDRGGDDGRLVIDARTGRILRFLPASRMGDQFDDALTTTYGLPAPPPPPAMVRGEPRPQHAAPKVASRTPAVPVPRPAPRAGEARPLAATTPAVRPAQPAAVQPAQQSVAAAPVKPADPQTTGTAAAAVPAAPVEVKPAPQILPTQDMPMAQGLE
jgi:hypothetical protein